MEGSCNLASDLDLDSDEEEVESQPSSIFPKDGLSRMKDIAKLKEEITELLDLSWIEKRTMNLLSKMLQLEDATITPKMIGFLLQDGVSDVFLGYITQVGGGPRPTSALETQTEALKLSYRLESTVLLTPDEPSNELMTFLGQKAGSIARAIFDVFRPDSAGSFYHAYRMIDCLLRCCPCQFYQGICEDGLLPKRMASMLHYIGYAPVSDIFISMITLAPIPRASAMFDQCAQYRGTFLEQLNAWNLCSYIVEIIVQPENCCSENIELVNGEQHSWAAAQLLQELSEKMSIEDTGEILLKPLGHTTEILDSLVLASVNNAIKEPIQRCALKYLNFLVTRSSNPELICMVSPGGNAALVPISVPNRLHPFRPLIISHLCDLVHEVFEVLVDYDNISDKHVGKSVHNGYDVELPFTTMRLLLLEFSVLMVEADETVAPKIPLELWTAMIQWVYTYAYNNIYHSYFYRILFSILRQNNDIVIEMVFQQASLASFLCNLYSDYPEDEDSLLPKHAPSDLYRKGVCRGIVVNCMNAIRLQVCSLPPSALLPRLLKSDPKWNETVTKLLSTTNEYHKDIGMGIRIVDLKSQQTVVPVVLSLGNETDRDSIDLGSRFANSLGFSDEADWPSDSE